MPWFSKCKTSLSCSLFRNVTHLLLTHKTEEFFDSNFFEGTTLFLLVNRTTNRLISNMFAVVCPRSSAVQYSETQKLLQAVAGTSSSQPLSFQSVADTTQFFPSSQWKTPPRLCHCCVSGGHNQFKRHLFWPLENTTQFIPLQSVQWVQPSSCQSAIEDTTQ